MDANTIIALLSFMAYSVGLIAYVSIRFSKLETEVKFLLAQHEDFKELKTAIYSIRAKMDVYFEFKSTEK